MIEDFNEIPQEVLSEYGINAETFQKYLWEEMKEGGDLAKVVADIETCADYISDKRNEVLSHPWFNDAQIEIFSTYLDGDLSHMLTDKNESVKRRVKNEDGLLACMLAAADEKIEQPMLLLSNMAFEAQKFQEKHQASSAPRM